jgi:hypothetical protein
VRSLAAELVRPLSQLRAVILQAAPNPDEVAVFLFDKGRLRGPAAFSTLGMRIQNEQSGSSSLFAQPMAIEPVVEVPPPEPLPQDATRESSVAAPARIPRSVLETRMEAALAALAEPSTAPSATERQGYLALLKRWYYRPEVRRTGEIFFPDSEGQWPIKAMLRAVGRVAAKMLSGAVRQ